MKRATRWIAFLYIFIGLLALTMGIVNQSVTITGFALLVLAGSIGLLKRYLWGWWLLTPCCGLLVLFEAYAIVQKFIEWHKLGYLFVDNGFQMLFGTLWVIMFPLSLFLLLRDCPREWYTKLPDDFKLDN